LDLAAFGLLERLDLVKRELAGTGEANQDSSRSNSIYAGEVLAEKEVAVVIFLR
jgi:hypothetical protein